MYQFFVEPYQIDIENKTAFIRGTDVNHIKNVLRMKAGEEIALKTGADDVEYRCGIVELAEDCIRLELRFLKESGVELPSRIILFQGLPKADKMELIIQKCVELGVYEIVPVAMKRCVVKLDEKKAQSKISRWQGISEAAAKQSKRAVIPKVHPVMNYEEALKKAQELDVRLVPYELAEGMEHTRKLLSGIEPGQSVGIFIGPEGGFDPSEIAAAQDAGAEPITLGKRILRTETAGMTVMAWLSYLLER